MNELTISGLKQWLAAGKQFELIDVREPYEHDHFNIGGRLMPLGEIIAGKNAIAQVVPVVIYCEKGIRSVIAIQRLEESGFQNLYNLKGGMQAWKQQLID